MGYYIVPQRLDLWVGKVKDCYRKAELRGVDPRTIRIVNIAEKALGYHQPLRVILCGPWRDDADLRDIVYYLQRLATIEDIIFAE